MERLKSMAHYDFLKKKLLLKSVGIPVEVIIPRAFAPGG
jgi:hypothetical protein